MAEHISFWCDKALVIRVEGPEGISTVQLDRPFARIGSHPQADVVLSQGRLPRRCVYLHVVDDGVFYVDLTGENPSRWLSPDKAFDVGKYRIQVSTTGSTAPVAAVPENLDASNSIDEPPVPVLRLRKTQQRIGLRLHRKLTLIGRVPPSKIRLATHGVSTTQCALFWDRGKLWVIDLLSSAGTELNGKSIDAALWTLGYRLVLGSIKIRFVRLSSRIGSDDVREKSGLPEPELPSPGLPTTGQDAQRINGTQRPIIGEAPAADLQARLERLEHQTLSPSSPHDASSATGSDRLLEHELRLAEIEQRRRSLDELETTLKARQASIEKWSDQLESMTSAIERRQKALEEQQIAWQAAFERQQSLLAERQVETNAANSATCTPDDSGGQRFIASEKATADKDAHVGTGHDNQDRPQSPVADIRPTAVDNVSRNTVPAANLPRLSDRGRDADLVKLRQHDPRAAMLEMDAQDDLEFQEQAVSLMNSIQASGKNQMGAGLLRCIFGLLWSLGIGAVFALIYMIVNWQDVLRFMHGS